ncbi:MAG: SspB family protein [Devosia sp.]
MAQDHIRYDILTQEALRGVVRKVLSEVAKTGLPGEHHFFISFLTKAPGVRVSQRLLEQYPADMTIVLQNQFWDLKVGETGFEVGLSFDDKPELLIVPFTAIKGFFDPSVQFGLQLTGATALPTDDEVAEASEPTRLVPAASNSSGAPAAAEAPGEKVVSLDAFRKK